MAIRRGCCFLVVVLLLAADVSAVTEDAVVSRIAFGSCSNQSEPQPIWDAILQFDPHVFIWLGDNIYGDNKHPFWFFGKQRTVGPWKNTERFFASSEQELQRRYNLAKNNPGYVRLRQRTKVIGTWDDHDYGLNDAGKEFSGKATSQKLMLDFLDEAQDSERRRQEGVYTSYMFGPKGRSVKVILLDLRYHRDPILSDGTILGESQWKWLERELNGPESEFTIIGSSIQVLSNFSAITGPLFYVESWGNFPKEKKRLFKLIDDSKRNGIFFISGDVHFGEITRFDCGTRYPMYDVTSSGLTQAVEKTVPPPLHFLVRVIALLVPTTMRFFTSNCRYRSCAYGQPNFGAITINWNAAPPSVKIELRDEHGQSVIEVGLSITELQPFNGHVADKNVLGYRRHCTLETDLPLVLRYQPFILLFCGITILVTRIMLSIYKICVKKFKTD